MEWKHTVNLEWMEARQRHLTASEVRQLIPFTATGRSRKITDETYMKIFSKKIIKLTEEDCKSYGAAARGHLLEPFAIDSANGILGTSLQHWDDVLVTAKDHVLAYSPDSLDVTCPRNPGVIFDPGPKVMGEVKSYGVDRHLECAMKPKMELEERWQIATAMAVSPSMEKAYLILYNPDLNEMSLQVCVHEYERDELEDEMKTILEVEQEWLSFLRSDPDTRFTCIHGLSDYSIEAIERKIQIMQEVNPV